MHDVSDETAALAAHISSALDRTLPAEVEEQTMLHIMDTIAAIVSGADLGPGRAGAAYARGSDGRGRSAVICTALRVDAVTAALANAMSAHADETDDSHEGSLSHPGCAVVPAAFAVGEAVRATGRDLLRAVTAGYDVGARVGMAIGHADRPMEGSHHSSHAYGGVYGAAAAAAAVHRLTPEQAAHVLSYAAESAGGTTTIMRDHGHVQKSFVFAGMPAANGVRAAELVRAGWEGVTDPFFGQPNVLDVFGYADRTKLAAGLGTRYEVTRTNIKKYAVGSPSQAAIQAALDLLADGGFTVDDITGVEIEIPHDSAPVVDDRDMPNINVQYLVAGTLVDGRFSFAMAHDRSRFTRDATIARLRGVTRLIPDPTVTNERQATVRIALADGTTVARFVPTVRGTVHDPMRKDEVREKASDLMSPVLGEVRAAALLDMVERVDSLADLGGLVALATGGDAR